MAHDLTKVTRVEVINHQDDDPSFGRAFVKYKCGNVAMDIQDGGKTLKVFISEKT